MKTKQILLIAGTLILLAMTVLVVFFYMTIQMSSPKTIIAHAPETSAEKVVKNDSAITIYLLEGDMIVLRSKGFVSQKMKPTEVRPHLINKKDVVAIIKPFEKASYKLTVDVLDEMQICGIKKYAIVDVVEADKEFLKSIK